MPPMGKVVKKSTTADPAIRRRRWPALLGIVLACAAAGVGWWRLGGGLSTARAKPGTATEPPPDPWFEEVAAESGVIFRHQRGDSGKFRFPEIVGGGAALFDYDNDGDLDLYFVQSGSLEPGDAPKPGNMLFRNRGKGDFEDVTAAAGVGDTGYGMGCTTGDYDNDGDIDLYVTNFGRNILYANQGDGTFKDVTEAAGVGCPAWSVSAAFADYDGDGFLDLYVTNYVSWSFSNELKCRDSTGRQDYCQAVQLQRPGCRRALPKPRRRPLRGCHPEGRHFHRIRQWPRGLSRRFQSRRQAGFLRCERRHAQPALDESGRRRVQKPRPARRLRRQLPRHGRSRHGSPCNRHRSGRRSRLLHHASARRNEHPVPERRRNVRRHDGAIGSWPSKSKVHRLGRRLSRFQ
ncbi:MAG: VCBS repeat-containing protein [Planctomycetes bacterium]|nr:VCBS repeat-containing protein [Planctomycetota bacterium]